MTCKYCEKQLNSKVKIYCNNQCQRDLENKTKIDLWLSNELAGGSHYGVRSWVKRYLIETRGEKCERCGWNERHPITGRVPIEVDHINGNSDHRIENLRLLCPNCHSLTPNYRALNKGNGRLHRRTAPEAEVVNAFAL